jgi:5-oxoprolinase (ATP-hydrolysing) subunit A
MVTVDLNADLAEGEHLTPRDLTILDVVTSASLACGFHAGNRTVMRAAAAACLSRGVAIGAHVSYRDRTGFGRRSVHPPAGVLVADIIEQCEVLSGQVDAAGGEVAYVKPHGALYNQMGVDAAVAAAVVEAIALQGIGVLVAQAGTVVADRAREAGLRVVAEGFPDRGYGSDGRLKDRAEPGALIADPAVVARRAVSLVSRGGVDAVDGVWTPIEAETLCIHGDTPDAGDMARGVRAALTAEGITVRPFVPRDRRRASGPVP